MARISTRPVHAACTAALGAAATLGTMATSGRAQPAAADGLRVDAERITSKEDMANGADVLLRSLLAIDAGALD